MLRPFCARAGVEARGSSRRLQRALVDFGAEESFARAAQRVREHYGVAGALWRQTAHAAGLGEKTQVHGVGDGAGWITTQFGEQFGGRLQ